MALNHYTRLKCNVLKKLNSWQATGEGHCLHALLSSISSLAFDLPLLDMEFWTRWTPEMPCACLAATLGCVTVLLRNVVGLPKALPVFLEIPYMNCHSRHSKVISNVSLHGFQWQCHLSPWGGKGLCALWNASAPGFHIGNNLLLTLSVDVEKIHHCSILFFPNITKHGRGEQF